MFILNFKERYNGSGKTTKQYNKSTYCSKLT